jgi:C1A family cysteine protease
MKWIFSLIIVLNIAHADLYQATAKNSESYVVGDREIILHTIWDKVLKKLPENKRNKYANYLQLSERTITKEIEEKVEPAPAPAPAPPKKKKKWGKLLGGGKSKVQAMLAKNKAKLKKMKLAEKQKEVEAKGRSYEDNLRNWAKKSDKFVKGSSDKVDKAIRSWKKKYESTLKKWTEERDKFLRRVDDYKKATFDIPEDDIKPVPAKIVKKKITIKIPSTYHVVPGALDIPVRDQKTRPTCAAFAGVRGIESVLMQNGVKKDLSEQYFYWASKPDCQNRPCSIKGSWVGYGLDHVKSKGIPTESSCPYGKTQKSSNETQIPLSGGCMKGSVTVAEYKMLNTLDEAVKALQNNSTIVASLKLRENFYRNQGIVFSTDKGADSYGSDGHAKGHAILLVGYIKLPPELHSKEGKICLLTANSWGLGWGRGGHACLSEKWILDNRGRNPLVAISKVNK